MNLREYQYVLKVAQLQNMTRAAEALYITQLSLSHYIARVEEELGVQLFNRLTTPLSLTPAGEKYVETAQMILELDSGLKKELSEIAKGKKGVITLGMSHARASFFLPYFLPAFRRKHPGIERWHGLSHCAGDNHRSVGRGGEDVFLFCLAGGNVLENRRCLLEKGASDQSPEGFNFAAPGYFFSLGAAFLALCHAIFGMGLIWK